MVSFFKPPTQSESKRRKRKKKHCFYFHGPAKLVEALSDTGFKLEYRGKTYQRSIRNMRKYKAKAEEGDEETLPPEPPMDVKKGSLIAVKDSDEPKDQHFHIAMVDEISDEVLKVRYFGTTAKTQAKAKFKPIWIDPESNKIRFSRPKGTKTEAYACRYV